MPLRYYTRNRHPDIDAGVVEIAKYVGELRRKAITFVELCSDGEIIDLCALATGHVEKYLPSELIIIFNEIENQIAWVLQSGAVADTAGDRIFSFVFIYEREYNGYSLERVYV